MTVAVEPPPRVPGLNRGHFWISEDFDAPLPEEFWLGQDSDPLTAYPCGGDNDGSKWQRPPPLADGS